MSSLPVNKEPVDEREPIQLTLPGAGKYRGFAVFLVCCGILIAAFAISALWFSAGGEGWFGGIASETTAATTADTTTTDSGVSTTATPSLEGETPSKDRIHIVDRDLSYPSLGEEYIHNETPYTPNAEVLLSREHQTVPIGTDPVVLILHTHTSEGYLSQIQDSLQGLPGDETYHDNPEQTVVAVGRVLFDTLNKNGVPAIHCTERLDFPSLQGAYERSAETVRKYLLRYPSIQYVIDLHRDSVLTSDGEYVRSLSNCKDPTAQIMAVVGSDVNGTENPNWEGNLSLALQLRRKLNAQGLALCRPVSLRNASYNQEMAPYSLLLEIGTGANTVKEAKRSAAMVGEALAELILGN